MASSNVILETSLGEHFPLVARGKVREIYALDESKLLFVATDRVSAFDVVLSNGIPHKGALLTIMTVHWFSVLKNIIPGLKTHFLSLELPPQIEKQPDLARIFRQRSMQVRKLDVFPIESIVRGYLTGSAWSEYVKSGTVHGIKLPEGMRESEKLKSPIWTPSTKAEQGDKDENISPERAAEIIGSEYAQKIKHLSLAIYSEARDYAMNKGIIIADTKFEFGLDKTNNTVVLVDEVLTPDSSRFWPAKTYKVGQAQDSLDKQYLRDWLTTNGLEGKEGVEMPPDVVQRTGDGYKDAFERLVGMRWEFVTGDEGTS